MDGVRAKKRQASLAKGPLDCALNLKVTSTEVPALRFYITLGRDVRRGPFEYSFTEKTVQGCEGFGVDWLQQVDSSGALLVTLDVVSPFGMDAS